MSLLSLTTGRVWGLGKVSAIAVHDFVLVFASVAEMILSLELGVSVHTQTHKHTCLHCVHVWCTHALVLLTPSTVEALSEAVKVLKGEYLVRAINEHKMDQVGYVHALQYIRMYVFILHTLNLELGAVKPPMEHVPRT